MQRVCAFIGTAESRPVGSAQPTGEEKLIRSVDTRPAARSEEALPAPAFPGLPRWWLAVVVVAGLAIRTWILTSPLGPVDSDEAVGGLIAWHFLHGDPATFLWGNVYGGTLEAILASPFFALVGTSALVIKLVMTAMYGVACLLTWRIGRRTVGARAGQLAAVLLWVSPAALVLISTKGRMYYGTTLVLTLGVVLCCLRLAESRSRRHMAVLGLLVGLGLWTAPFFFYVAVPIVAWLVLTRPRRLLDAPLAVPGAVLGAAPWLAFNLKNDWASLHENPAPFPSTYLDRLESFFTDLLPRVLGLRGTYSGDWLGGAAGQAVYVGLLAAFVAFAVWALARRRSGLLPVVTVVAAYPFLFAAPQASVYVNEPRYGLFLAPFLALLLAAGLTRLLRARAASMAVVALAIVLTVGGLAHLMDWARAHPGNHDLTSTPVGPLIAELERRRITTAYADYWIAYTLTFESEERIIASPVDFVRYPPYHERLAAAGTTTYLFFDGSGPDRDFHASLVGRGAGFRRVVVADFAIYLLNPPLT